MQLKNGKSAPSAIGHSVYEPISNKLFSLAALSDRSSRPGTSLSDPRQPSGHVNYFIYKPPAAQGTNSAYIVNKGMMSGWQMQPGVQPTDQYPGSTFGSLYRSRLPETVVRHLIEIVRHLLILTSLTTRIYLFTLRCVSVISLSKRRKRYRQSGMSKQAA